MFASLVSVALLASSTLAGSDVISSIPSLLGCPSSKATFSCENTTVIENTCCSPTPGGLVLLTQFWSTWTGNEKKGVKLPKESWSIHGLWPDNCDGSYEQYCDLSRQYDPEPGPPVLPDGTVVPPYKGPSIDHVIKDFNRHDLLRTMNDYWINQASPNEVLWAHEYAKHATCMSTYDVSCYGADYKKNEDVINYFDSTIRAFRKFPTYDMLAAYNIRPSNKTGYPLDKIVDALKAQTGATPYLGCRNGTILTEVWYFNHVYGTDQYGAYKSVETTLKSNCNATLPIWYYERAKG